MPNKQDDVYGWRWPLTPLTFLGGERATRESELTRPLYHAAWVVIIVAIGVLLVVWECALIGRALPLFAVVAGILWLAWPALFGPLPLHMRLTVAVIVAFVVGAWWFYLGPLVLNRAWFPLWWGVDAEWLYLLAPAPIGARRLPLWTLWLRLALVVGPALAYVAAAGPLLIRFWMEIMLPGLSAVRAFPVEVWRLPFPPFSWFSPADKAEPVETQTVIGPDLEPHTEPLTHTHTTMRSNGSGLSWRREVVALGLTDAQWVEIARRALGGVGWTDNERLPGVALHDWRKLRLALASVRWLDNPTGRRYELTEYGREQLERLAAGDLGPIGK